MMRKWLLALLFAVGLAGAAHAEERILDYLSDVKVERNGDLLVTETIRVMAEGREIRRGLLRDFPTSYANRDGTTTRVGFEVLGVKRDGTDEPYAEKGLSNGVRIQIGSGDVLLDRGEHTYEIRYRTTRQVGFFDTHDEVYWNATGISWTFPIERARARITLPEPVEITQSASYTGAQGSRASNARVTVKQPGTISFATTRRLEANEGLTVAAGFAKGLITPPSRAEAVWLFVQDNLVFAVAVGGFAVLVLYYLGAVRRTRRPTPPMVVPLFEAPDGLTAPDVRYISRQGFDQRTFVVGVLELVATRAMQMQKTEQGLRFTKLDRAGRDGGLPALLDGMLDKLFRKDKTFLREDVAAGTRFTNAQERVQTRLEKAHDKLFAKHRAKAHMGVLLWVLWVAACVGTAILRSPQGAGHVAMSIGFCLPAIIAFTAVFGAWRRRTLNWIVALFVVLVFGPFLAGGIATAVIFGQPVGLGALPALLPVLMLPVVVRAYTFLRGYTDEGYRVMDQIAGFKQYLTLAESPRLQALATPEEKLGVYEQCLPYAVALDVGEKWAAAFAGAFAGVAGMAAVESVQQMYGGHDLLSGNPDRTAREMSRDVAPRASELASTSSSGGSGSWRSSGGSSSSSGSSGGGSSGGGGGGGGGSGW
jgi:uncharacterized membrane protein YgcG